MLQRKGYNLCLFDISTPAVNGRQLYEYIIEKYPNLLNGAIFTAGSAVTEDAKVFMVQTGRLFLRKPFAPEWLKEIVSNTLKGIHNDR